MAHDITLDTLPLFYILLKRLVAFIYAEKCTISGGRKTICFHAGSFIPSLRVWYEIWKGLHSFFLHCPRTFVYIYLSVRNPQLTVQWTRWEYITS